MYNNFLQLRLKHITHDHLVHASQSENILTEVKPDT